MIAKFFDLRLVLDLNTGRGRPQRTTEKLLTDNNHGLGLVVLPKQL